MTTRRLTAGGSTWGWCLLAFIVLSAVSRLVPPMQSPDETSHLMRAAMLANGQWSLQAAPAGTPRELNGLGGWVDKNLALFGHDFLAIATRQNSRSPLELQHHHATLPWAGEAVFYPAPGTGYYFPLIYAPQAIALGVGKAMGLGIASSYQLARSLTLLVVCLVTALAWWRFAPNAAAVVVATLPMGLFQAVSPTLDGLTTALALLAISEFFRQLSVPARSNGAPAWLLWACLFLVITSRTHLLPMLLMPLYLAWRRRSWPTGVGGLVLVVACVAWIFYAMANTTDARVVREHATTEILRAYLSHPLGFLQLVGGTLAHENNLVFYAQSFIGILGWLDTPLLPGSYPLIGTAVFAAVLASVPWGNAGANAGPRLCLVAVSAGAVMMTFLALAATWTPYPAVAIEGVQGRYFVVPALLLCYGLGSPDPVGKGLLSIRSWRALVMATAVTLSLGSLILTLQQRYHLVF